MIGLLGLSTVGCGRSSCSTTVGTTAPEAGDDAIVVGVVIGGFIGSFILIICNELCKECRAKSFISLETCEFWLGSFVVDLLICSSQ